MLRQVDNGIELFAQSHMVKVLMVMTLMTSSLSIVLACTLFNLLPLKEIKPYFFTHYEKAEQIVKIEPLEKAVAGSEKLLANFAGRVIKLWHTIDLKHDAMRWEELGFYLSEPIAKQFNDEHQEDNKEGLYYKMQQARLNRFIKIENIAQITQDTFQIDWDTFDLAQSDIDWEYFKQIEDMPIKQHRKWRTILKFELMPQVVQSSFEHINPVGFVVNDIATSPREVTPLLNRRSDI